MMELKTYTEEQVMDICDEKTFFKEMPIDLESTYQCIAYFGTVMQAVRLHPVLYDAAGEIMKHLHYRYILFDDEPPTDRDIAFKLYYETNYPYMIIHSDVLQYHAPLDSVELISVEECQPIPELPVGRATVVNVELLSTVEAPEFTLLEPTSRDDVVEERFLLTNVSRVENPVAVGERFTCLPASGRGIMTNLNGQPSVYHRNEKRPWKINTGAFSYDDDMDLMCWQEIYAYYNIGDIDEVTRTAFPCEPPTRWKTSYGISIDGVTFTNCCADIWLIRRSSTSARSAALFILTVRYFQHVGMKVLHVDDGRVWMLFRRASCVRRLTDLSTQAMVKACLRSIM